MIKLTGINKTFYLGDQAVHALNNIDLTIKPGAYVSVMGPSGSGKSTLLNAIGLLDRPDQGQYLLNDVDTGALDEEGRTRLRRDQIGFVFQSYHLIGRLSARENIELPMTLAGIAPAKRRVRVDELLDRLGLTSRADHLPNQLSGGQRQRVAIGRAILMKPSVMLADEPTGNLDSKSGAEVIELLEDLNQQGITLLIVTHDPDLGRRARQRIRMVDGAIVENDTENETGHAARV